MTSRTPRLALLAGGLTALAAGLGCSSTAPMQYPISAAQVSLSAPASLADRPGADGSTAEVRTVFGEWVAARSHGDRATFEGLYDVKRFEGVRRAPSGVEKRLTWSEWEAEQRPAVLRGETTHVLRPVFESWPGGTLDLATASVAFEEETLGAPATRGQRSGEVVSRVLVFGRSPDGKLRIVREELGAAAGARSLGNTLSRDAKVAQALKN